MLQALELAAAWSNTDSGIQYIYTALAIVLLYFLASLLPRRRLQSSHSVLVTGTGSGIGKQIVDEVSRDSKATLVCWDINATANAATSALLESRQCSHVKQTVDTSSDESVRAAAAALSTQLTALGQPCATSPAALHALVSCAGVVCGKDVDSLTAAEVERTFGVNCIAHWNLLRSFLPALKARVRQAQAEGGGGPHGHAVVVLVSSVMASVGSAQLSDYCASKAATNALAECLRLELQRDGLGCPDWTCLHSLPLLGPLLAALTGPPRTGIAVVTVCPYAVNTGMFAGILSSPQEPWVIRSLLRPLLFPVLTPAQVSHAVCRAIEAGVDAHVTLPAHAYWMALAMRALLPLRLYDAVVGLLGGWHGMSSFKGPGMAPLTPTSTTPARTAASPKGGRSRAKSKA